MSASLLGCASAEFAYFSVALREEARELESLIAHKREQQQLQLSELQQTLAQEYASYIQRMNTELEVVWTHRPKLKSRQNRAELASLSEENSRLHRQLERLQTEKAGLANESDLLEIERLHPLELSIKASRTNLQRQFFSRSSCYDQEIARLEQTSREQDAIIQELNEAVAVASQEIAQVGNRREAAELTLREQIHRCSDELNYLESTARSTAREQRTVQTHSKKLSKTSTELAKLKELSVHLRSKAQRLNDLVYGRSDSPPKSSPLKSARKLSPHKRRTSKHQISPFKYTQKSPLKFMRTSPLKSVRKKSPTKAVSRRPSLRPQSQEFCQSHRHLASYL